MHPKVRSYLLVGLTAMLALPGIVVNAGTINVEKIQNRAKAEIAVESYYMRLHQDYRSQFDPAYLAFHSQKTLFPDVDFTLDTVRVKSIQDDQTRYIYTYSPSPDYYRLMTQIEVWDGQIWQPRSKQQNEYDDYGNVLNSTWQVWEGSGWVNSSKKIYTYDGDLVLSTLIKTWQSGSWVNLMMGSYTYNTNGLVVSYLEEIWEEGDWQNHTHEVYTFDDNNNMLTAFGEYWGDSLWVNDQKHTYTYDNSNLHTATDEEWISGEWEYIYRQTYTHNAAGQPTAIVGEVYDDENWQNSQKDTYDYNASGQPAVNITQSWQSGAWLNAERNSYTYDNYGGVESHLIKSWEDDAWQEFSLTQYSYDNYGNGESGDYYVWHGGTWLQIFDGPLTVYGDYGGSIEHYAGYHVVAAFSSTTVGIEQANVNGPVDFYCYPNPADGVVYIEFRDSGSYPLTINISDIHGKALKKIYMGF
ncbi:MAG: T9SS type A sorting domain-containing protein, partial [Bacteroidales bacterium]|nr:T9SS type A sorting domain-containing protein [Bacteroidales bacterium]